MSRLSRPRPSAPRPRWLLAAAAGTLYAAALALALVALRARHAPHLVIPAGTLAGAISASLPEPRRTDRATAYLVARAADCTGNLEFLDLFERPPIHDRIDLVAALALGDESAATTLRHALAARGLDIPVRVASPALRAALATVGHHATPYLLVLDRNGALRFAIGAPESVRQYLALGATLPLLGDSEAQPRER